MVEVKRMDDKIELFDAYDIHGNKLNIDLVRGEQPKKGLYHLVAEIYCINERNELLVTKRHPNKSFPLCWKITGGSVLSYCNIYVHPYIQVKETNSLNKNNKLN